MKIVAIVQARMGSTRLPGKVMKEILEKPVILWDIERLKKSKLIDEIVIAISPGKENEIIEKTVKENTDKVAVTIGSEADVLDRYYQSAVKTKADVIIRITSDCPLIDPVVVDHVIEQFLQNDCDYCSNSLERTYPRGLDTEVFSFKALEKAWKEAKKDHQREHVTPYIYENPDKFKLFNVANKVNLSYLRWTLDTKEDFELINTIYERIYPKKHMFFMQDILELLKKEPKLIEINRHIEQKKLK